MPELPEVETIKRALEKSIGQCKITDVVIKNHKLRQVIPPDTESKIKGANIVKYQRWAKYIILTLDNNISLIWHMGMSGKISISDKMPKESNKHDHIIITTTNGVMTYNDPRRFGLFTYTNTSDLNMHALFKENGPEPLEETFNEFYMSEKLKTISIPIKAAILNQRIVVGIGNIYASEALFIAGISPLRPANSLTAKDCKNLVSAIKEVLLKAIAAGGSTLRDYEKPDGSLGYFQHQHCVYQKTGQRCPNCNCDISVTGGIKKINIAGRSTFYCQHKRK